MRRRGGILSSTEAEESKKMRVIVAVLFGVVLSASALATESTADSAEDAGEPPVCKRAMVSPGTGTVICVDPFGAAVEAPPPQEAPCKPGKQTGGVWTPGSGCSEE